MMKTQKRKRWKVAAPKRNLKMKRKKNKKKGTKVVAPRRRKNGRRWTRSTEAIRWKIGEDLKESYLIQVQCFLDRGKTQDYAEIAAFNTLLPVSRRRLRRTYLERLKWTHHIQHDAIHRKVMTLSTLYFLFYFFVYFFIKNNAYSTIKHRAK